MEVLAVHGVHGAAGAVHAHQPVLGALEGGKIIGMSIENGKTYKIAYSVDSSEMFASEVILNAYR